MLLPSTIPFQNILGACCSDPSYTSPYQIGLFTTLALPAAAANATLCDRRCGDMSIAVAAAAAGGDQYGA
jgi:hypothetical protein